MKRIQKTVLPLLFVFALGVGLLGFSAATFAAGTKGPNKGKNAFAYLIIYQNKGYDSSERKKEVVLYGSKNFLSTGQKKVRDVRCMPFLPTASITLLII